LAELLELENIEGLAPTDAEGYFMGRVGVLKKTIGVEDFVKYVKEKLKADRLVVSGNINKNIKKIGICTGAGSNFIPLAASKGCDAYITGDMKYHDGQMAEDLDICVIDGTHYLTEVVAMPVLKAYVESKSEGIECVLSDTDTQTLKIF
jgi:putative NIF3 family GTP cyclohydrolase 1 type 2